MSTADIDRLIAERSLERFEFNDGDIAGFWSKALTSFTDAGEPNLSPEGSFQLAYTAGLQATFAALAASGLRVKGSASHYKAFYALQRLGDDKLRTFATRMDDLRQLRHQSVYEPIEDDANAAADAAEARAMLEAMLPDVKVWLVRQRPGLDGVLDV